MTEVNWKRLTDLEYQPRAKLFLSVDIVGSTALKQRELEASVTPAWPAVISAFYGTARSALDDSWEVAERACNDAPGANSDMYLGSPPKFWKDVTLETQVWMTVSCWISTLKALRTWLRDYSDPSVRALDVKATIWLASFPIRNRLIVAHEVGTPEYRSTIEYLYGEGSEINASSFDFIGAGIDIGFRLASFASSQKLIIDLGTALLLAKSAGRMNDHSRILDWNTLLPTRTGRVVDLDNKKKITERLGIFYDGSTVLRGVLGGIQYPLFWIDTACHDSMEYHQEQLIYPKESRRIRQKWSVLGEYCESVYQDRKSFIRQPYLAHKGSMLKEGRFLIEENIKNLVKDRIDKLNELEIRMDSA